MQQNDALRGVAHFLSVALVVPAVAFASMFVAIGHVASKPGFWAFLLSLLEAIVVLLPWLLACLALLVTLAILGFSRRYRWATAICVAGIAIGSTGVLIWLQGSIKLDEAAFHLPAVFALVIAVWLAVIEWPQSAATQR